jgi:uncharacterized membrane protein
MVFRIVVPRQLRGFEIGRHRLQFVYPAPHAFVEANRPESNDRDPPECGPIAGAKLSCVWPGSPRMNEHRVHQIFQLSILLKGAHAAIECAGGIALALISTSTIANLVNRLSQEELIEDPHDFLATHLLAWAQSFSVATQHFYAFYLLGHGAVKMLLVIGLLKGKLWSYPASLVVFGLFIVYQLYRFSYTHGAGLIVLTVLDMVVMVLIWREYGLMRRHLPGK